MMINLTVPLKSDNFDDLWFSQLSKHHIVLHCAVVMNVELNLHVRLSDGAVRVQAPYRWRARD